MIIDDVNCHRATKTETKIEQFFAIIVIRNEPFRSETFGSKDKYTLYNKMIYCLLTHLSPTPWQTKQFN